MDLLDDEVKLCDLYAPTHILPMKKFNEDYPWYEFFHKNNIRGIVYAFYYKNQIIKIGCSFSKYQSRSDKNTSYCERLVRQIKNLPGGTLGTRFIPEYGMIFQSKNGENIVEEIQSLEKELNVKINRNDIYVHVWNITDIHSNKYFFTPDDKGNKMRALYFESLVVHQYKKDNNNKLPLGNRKQDPSTWNSAYTKPQIAKELGEILVWDT